MSVRSLCRLLGVPLIAVVAMPFSSPAPLNAQVTYERLVQAKAEPHNWFNYSGSYASERFSSLDQINTGNVADLRVEWIYQTSPGLVETTPVVVDGMMYLTEPPSTVTALDARTGRRIWRWDANVARETLNIGFPRVNRGVAILGETVFVGTLDARLVALDAESGVERWSTEVADNSVGFSMTGAPLAIDGKVIVGVAGAEAGIRGFLDAYDAETGELLWRTYTILAGRQLGARRGLDVADGFLRSRPESHLLGNRQPRPRLERRPPTRRQPLYLLAPGLRRRYRRDPMALSIHAARCARLGRE
jgi:glucose dehydrogenase